MNRSAKAFDRLTQGLAIAAILSASACSHSAVAPPPPPQPVTLQMQIDLLSTTNDCSGSGGRPAKGLGTISSGDTREPAGLRTMPPGFATATLGNPGTSAPPGASGDPLPLLSVIRGSLGLSSRLFQLQHGNGITQSWCTLPVTITVVPDAGNPNPTASLPLHCPSTVPAGSATICLPVVRSAAESQSDYNTSQIKALSAAHNILALWERTYVSAH